MTRKEAIKQLEINKKDDTYVIDDEALDMAIEALNQEPCEAISRQAAKERVMFVSRRKYELEKLIAKQRIEHLEYIICQGEHDYKKVATKTVAYDTLFGNDLHHDVYMCKRCGKVRE